MRSHPMVTRLIFLAWTLALDVATNPAGVHDRLFPLALPLHHSDLDKTMLGKPNSLACLPSTKPRPLLPPPIQSHHISSSTPSFSAYSWGGYQPQVGEKVTQDRNVQVGAEIGGKGPGGIKIIGLDDNTPPPGSRGRLAELMDFPSNMEIKIIGKQDDTFVNDVVKICTKITNQTAAEVPVRWRDKGRWRSVTITLFFKNPDMVYDVYEAVDRDPRVRYKI